MTTVQIPPIRSRVFCGAMVKDGSGRTCRRSAGHGTGHLGYGSCFLHGGNTESHVKAAALASARETARLFGVPREINPIDGLLEEYWRTAGLIDAYEAMCVQLLPREVVWGTTSVEESQPAAASDGGESLTPPERKVKSGPGINIWVKLLNEERDRFAKLGEALLRLDLDSRRLTFEQSQVAALVTVLLDAEVALSEDQRRAVARKLRALDVVTSGASSIAMPVPEAIEGVPA